MKDIKDKATKIIALLKISYPNARCSLNFSNALELLIATILSAQCTDERVNEVTKKLFSRYSSVEDYAKADFDELVEIIKSAGFYRNKAKSIIESCKIIRDNFNGIVPNNINDLVKLRGVARKTANVVLQNYYNVSVGVVVDTHVGRLAKRMGLTKNSEPGKIEMDLMKVIDKKDWAISSHLFIAHGRAVCKARKPECDYCVLNDICSKRI